MKAKFEAAILRTQGEYVADLATAFITTLRTLEQGFGAGPVPHTTAHTHAERLSALEQLLTTEVDSLRRRLDVFLQQTLPTSRLVAAPSPLEERE